MFKLTAIDVTLFITTAINIVVSYISWQRRKTKGGIYFSLGIFGITFWTLAAALDYAAIPLYLKVFFAKAEAIGYYSAIALFAVFSISYAGHERWLEKRWVKAVFVFIPLTAILLTITNEFHHAIWNGFVQKENNIVVFEHGPMFNWTVIANYILTIFIFVNLWMASRKGSDITRRQARILMLALLFPIAINLLYREGAGGIEGIDWTSITFSVSGMLFLYALYGIRLLDIVPIARDKLINSLGDGMIVLDTQNRIVDVNQPAQIAFNVPIDSLIGKDLTEIEPLSHTVLEQNIEQEVKTEFEVEVGDGTRRTFDVLISPLREERKLVIGRLLIFRDITEHKIVETALRASEERFRQLMMSAPDSVFGVNEEGSITFANEAATRLLGYSLDEFTGMKVDELLPERFRRGHAVQRAEYVSNPRTRFMGSGLNLVAIHKEGSEIPVDIKLSHIKTDVGILVIAFMRDITEQKLVEGRLRQQASFIEHAHAAIITRDLSGFIRYWNPRAFQVYGWKGMEVVGKLAHEILETHYSTSREEVEQALLETGYWEGELTQVCKDGRRVVVSSHQALQRDALGITDAILEINLDITERVQKDAALQEAHDQIVNQQREIAAMEERQRIARNLHDSLSQSIHSLGLFSETLAAAIDRNDLERAKRILERVQESAQQSHKETRLLLYELQNPNTERVVNLVQALEERLEKVERHAGVKAQLIQEGSLEYCPQEWYENLFWITIEALNNTLKHAFARRVQVHLRFSPQRMELEVSDDGRGFDVSEANSGGLGLGNLHTRAGLIGGELTIESQSEKGTTVRFYADIPLTK
jgi:PAS domain S-box-containing protein